MLYVFLLTLRLLHVLLRSRDTWFIACVTLGLLHVFKSHDTWFIAWMTLGLLHVLLLAHDLLHVFLMSRDTWFIA